MKIRYLLAASFTLLLFALIFATGAAPAGAQPAGAKATPTPKKKTNCETPRPDQQAPIAHSGSVGFSNVVYQGTAEYVEVKNFGTAPASIGGWTIRDKNEVAQKFTFPAGVTIPKGGTVRVYTSKNKNSPYSFNKNKPIWNDCGDAIELLNTSNKVVATYAYKTHLKK